MRDVHVIYTDFPGFGWGISSPQVPELAGGSTSIDDALADTPRILALAGFDEGDYVLIQHEQKYVQSPTGQEYFLRFTEPLTKGRQAVIGRTLAAVESGAEDDELHRMPTTPTGERIVIGCEADDKIGWILDQLAEGEGTTVQYYAGDDAVYSVPIYDGDREYGNGSGLEELGLDRENTVTDLIDRVMSAEAADMRTVTKRTLESA